MISWLLLATALKFILLLRFPATITITLLDELLSTGTKTEQQKKGDNTRIPYYYIM